VIFRQTGRSKVVGSISGASSDVNLKSPISSAYAVLQNSRKSIMPPQVTHIFFYNALRVPGWVMGNYCASFHRLGLCRMAIVLSRIRSSTVGTKTIYILEGW